MITTSSFLRLSLFGGNFAEPLSRVFSRYAVGSTVHYLQFGYVGQPRPEHVRRIELWCRKHCLVTRWATERGHGGAQPDVLVIEFREGLVDLFRREISGPEALRETPRFFLRSRVVDRELLARAVLLSSRSAAVAA